MLPLEAIPCPHCGKVQKEDIYDLTNAEDSKGSFMHTCDRCEKEFQVSFEFLPRVTTREIR